MKIPELIKKMTKVSIIKVFFSSLERAISYLQWNVTTMNFPSALKLKTFYDANARLSISCLLLLCVQTNCATASANIYARENYKILARFYDVCNV